MSEWKKVNLGDLIEVKHGFAFKGAFITDEENKNILVTPGNFHIGGGFKNTKFKYYNSDDFPSECILNEGDVVVTMTDLSKDSDTLGYSAKIPKIENVNFLHNQRIGLVQFKSKNADKDFFYWLMRTRDYQGFIVGSASGTSIMHTSPSRIKEYEFSLPPLSEQKSIASVLSNLDDKIDLLHRQNITLEKMAETLFRQWFVEEADEEWEEITFGDFVIPKKGKNITKSEAVAGHYPVVAGGLEPSCYHNEANTKSPVITISASGANAGYVKLYTIPVWSSDSSYIDETITPYVYFSYIFLKVNQSQLSDKQEGSAQPHIYPRHIMELDTLDYPENLICSFEESVKPFFLKIKTNQTQIRTLTALRDTLLPKLMSGEVRVEK
jgi:type I restriction enzyme S subunit